MKDHIDQETEAQKALRLAEQARVSAPVRQPLDRPRAPHEAMGIDEPSQKRARGTEIRAARVAEVSMGLSRNT